MKIVSNTGPIIGLAKIELLFLLNEVASKVLIPPMVYRELLGKVGMESEQIDKALKEFLFVTDLNPLDPATEMAISAWKKVRDRRLVSLRQWLEMFCF